LLQNVVYTIIGGTPLSLKPTVLLWKSMMIYARVGGCRDRDPLQRSRIRLLNHSKFRC